MPSAMPSKTESEAAASTANSGLKYDPAFFSVVSPWANIKATVSDNPQSVRATTDGTLARFYSQIPRPPAVVTETTFQFKAKDGEMLNILRFTPPAYVAPANAKPTSPQPAVLYIHGGGLISGSVSLFKQSIINYAGRSGLPFFAVSYRLAPEHPYPGPLEDVYAALEWLRDNSKEQNVDPARIALFGPSAGGALAAGAALMARDKGFSPPIKKLVLLYPMLDDRTDSTVVGPDHPLNDYLTWTVKHNEIGWNSYLGAEKGKVSPYAAPARAADVTGLPATYIDTGNIDLFRDEIMAFGSRLAAANVDVEMHVYPGVPHIWEVFAPDVPSAKKAIENRLGALREL